MLDGGLQQDRAKHSGFGKGRRRPRIAPRTRAESSTKCSQRRGQVYGQQARSFRRQSTRYFQGAPAQFAGRRAPFCRRGDGTRTRDYTISYGSGFLRCRIAHWKHEPLHDVVEPMTHHVIMAYNGTMQRMERRSGRSVAIGTFRPGVVIIIPEGSSSRWDIPKPVDVVQLYLPHTVARARCPRSRRRQTNRPFGTNGASRPHYIPIDLDRGRCHGGKWATGYAFQTSADRAPGHARPGCAQRLANLVPTDHGWVVAEAPCSAPSNACARTVMQTSPSLQWLPKPGCRAFISAVPSRKAPGFRLTPGCASIGSSKP